MLDSRDLVSAVERYWQSATASTAPTVYPGGRLDTSEQTAWYELWVETFDSRPQRRADPDRRYVTLLVHCFSRHASRKRAVHDLADVARRALEGASVPIHDRSEPTPLVTGYVTIQEVAIRDLSRNHAAVGQERLQHLVLVTQAVAHELSTP